MRDFTELLRPKAEEFAARYSLEIYDIIFKREKEGKVLRIYLDGAVNLDSCAAISRLISEWVDEQGENFVPHEHYRLEVSSLGIDRPLRSAKEFLSHKGKLCRIQTKDKDSAGRKRYKGRITDVSNGAVTIYAEEERNSFIIEIDGIAKANAEVEI
ncbi:MAG: ribosome maturation factor RimP [Deferribacteraceae bacterium]|jgi:ribosome maturation factor RimP|nr:ribosome maturation factor RimP [Deferribacteraceae bacterium]